MKEGLNLQCRYKIFLDRNTFIYSFITKNDIEYNVAFADNVAMFKDTSVSAAIRKVYSLDLQKKSSGREPLDLYVQEAVIGIVTHFFNDKENSLMYVCDFADSREKLRHKKFNKWYDDSIEKSKILKLHDTLGDHPQYYISILYHAENPFRQQLEQGYFEMLEPLKKP